MQKTSPPTLGGPSFWFDTMGGLPPARPSASGQLSADVVVIGAGYTGLWTAYYLKTARPDLRVTILEARVAGYGASGRNGGWLTGGFAWSHARYAAERGEHATRAFVQAMNGTVAEVLRVANLHKIDADIHPTTELALATSPAQMARLRDEFALRSHWGEADRLRLLSATEARARVNAPGTLGALEVAGVARIHPAKLVRALAEICLDLGVEIFENSPVTKIGQGYVVTNCAEIRAPYILRCTEGFSATLERSKRDFLPLNSAQIATAPMDQAIWDQIGFHDNEIVGDLANVYCYCQRTADNRLLVGSRGTPYRFGSRLDTDGKPDPATIENLKRVLARLFPAAASVPITHAWCGTLGVPRDWCATIGFDPRTGLGYAGGYVGVGVSTSNLSGRVLCDLVLGQETALTRLPLVNRPLRRWEREPLRWLAVRGMYAALHLADAREARNASRPSRIGAWALKLGGRG